MPQSFLAKISTVESKKTSSMDCSDMALTELNPFLPASSTPSAKEIASCSTSSIAWSRKRNGSYGGRANVRVTWHHSGSRLAAHHQRHCDDGSRSFRASLQTTAPEVHRAHTS